MNRRELSELIKNKIKGLNENIIQAFAKVPREDFVYSGINEGNVYFDEAIPTYYGGNILSTSSQPSLMALFFKEAGLTEGKRVFEIGTGTGYNAAIISEIVGEKGLVVSTEPEEEIFKIARKNLKYYKNVILLNKDGYYGYKGETFDIIISTIAVDGIPVTWINQLKNGGKIIAPIVLGNDFTDYTFLIEKDNQRIYAKFLIHTSFLRAIGKLSFKKNIIITKNEFSIVKELNIQKRLFEFCVTFYNSSNGNILIDSEYGIYNNGILKYTGKNMLDIFDNLKNVDIFNSEFIAVKKFDFLNFIPA